MTNHADDQPIPWSVWRRALVIAFGAFMSGLDASVVNVGLDTIASDLVAVPAGTAAYKAVTTAQLPDATTQVNIVQRVGGALGGAIFAVILANRFADGVSAAFQASFLWLTGVSALGLATALWLALAERRASRHREIPAIHSARPV